MGKDHVDSPRADTRGPGLDRTLTIVIAVLGVAIIALAGWFGYSVWANNQRTESTNAPTRVISALEQQIRTSPNDPVIRVRLGEAYGAAGRFEEAVKQFNEALKIDPEHIGAHLDLGMVAMLTDEDDKAEKYFNKVLDLTDAADFTDVDERRENALYNLGLLKLRQEKYPEAAGYFKEALRIRKDASDTYVNLARALRGMEEFDAAISNLEIAIAFDPSFAEAHFTMGEIYQQQGDDVNASYHLFKAAELAPEAQEPQEALAAFGPASDWIGKSEAARERGDLEGALDAVLVARNLDPKSIEPVLLHGEVLVERGDVKDAVEVYLEAVKMDAADERAAAALAKLEGAERAAVRAVYRAQLKKNPESEYLKAAVVRLK